jgi:hypothetical protein
MTTNKCRHAWAGPQFGNTTLEVEWRCQSCGETYTIIYDSAGSRIDYDRMPKPLQKWEPTSRTQPGTVDLARLTPSKKDRTA